MSDTKEEFPVIATTATTQKLFSDVGAAMDALPTSTSSSGTTTSSNGVHTESPFDILGRREARRHLNDDFEYETAPATKKTKIQTNQEEDVEAEFDTEWICCECKEAECQLNPEATDMLVCDGPCRRLVHYPCAGLNTIPSDDENFYCGDCIKKAHICMVCAEYGEDNNDVFQCSHPKCGLFFHESCLDMQNVKIVHNSAKEGDSASTRRVFVCPAHSCWTCTQQDLQESEMEPTDEESLPLSTNKSSKRKRREFKGAKAGSKVFEAKGDGRLLVRSGWYRETINSNVSNPLQRCMECARSYHVTCIPPSAKFHELALLCHEHAESRTLPELDKEASIQRSLEQRAENLISTQRTDDIQVKESMQLLGDNVFFCGLEGANFTSQELRLASAFDCSSIDDGRGELHRFCLPCDMKEEVYSKPPGYKHVNSLQYQPGNKPPLLPQAGDMCECVGVCGENCINRTLYTECFGDKFKLNGSNSRQTTNCNVGADCGNRQLGQRRTAKCQPSPEEGRGWGLVALQKIQDKSLVIEYVGEVIDEATKDQRLTEWSKEHPNDTNFYIMALQSNWYIDARLVANTARFINHSCNPNCILLPINVGGFSRCGIFALRDIEPGEFLSYDYHFDTQQTDKFTCCCGALKCRGTMKHTWTLRESVGDEWEVAKADFQRDKKFLESRKFNTTSLVSSYLPAAGVGSKDEFVGNGPLKKHFLAAQHNRIFLGRNATVGFNCFALRLGSGEEDIICSDND